MARLGQLEAQLQILHQVSTREPPARDIRPRKRHAAAHELTRQPETQQTARPHFVTHQPGELSDATQGRRPRGQAHEVARLDWPARAGAEARKLLDRSAGDQAIRIDDDEHARWMLRKMPHTKIQREALAALLDITALDD